MRRTFTMLGISAATASSLLFVSAPSASAATLTFSADTNVKLRAKTTTNSTALKLIPKNASVKVQKSKYGNSVERFIGSTHNACGSKGTSHKNLWYKVTYKGSTGYSPGNCLSPR